MKLSELFEAALYDANKNTVLISLNFSWTDTRSDSKKKGAEKFVVNCQTPEMAKGFLSALKADESWKLEMAKGYVDRSDVDGLTAKGNAKIIDADEEVENAEKFGLEEFLKEFKEVKFDHNAFARTIKPTKKNRAKPTFTKYTDYGDWHDKNAGRYSETEIDGLLVGLLTSKGKLIGMWYNKAGIGSISHDFGRIYSDIPLEDMEVYYVQQDPNFPD